MHDRAGDGAMLDEVLHQIKHLSVPNGGKLKMFTRCRRSREYEDSRTNNRADAQRRKRDRAQRLLQARLGVLRIGDQLVDGFLGEELAGGNLRTP